MADDGEMLTVNPRLRIPLSEFEFTFSRSSGPGGQNVNKVNTKALLRWGVAHSPSLPEGVRARFMAEYHRRITTEGVFMMTSQRYRDAPRNVADCLEKLQALLASVATPPKRRRPTKPTRGSVARRLTNKKEQSERKQQRQKGLSAEG